MARVSASLSPQSCVNTAGGEARPVSRSKVALRGRLLDGVSVETLKVGGPPSGRDEIGTRHILFWCEAPPLLQVRTSAEALVNRARQDHRPRRPLLTLASRASELLVPALRGELLARCRVILRLHSLDLVAQGSQKRLGDGIARAGPVELEDPDVSCAGRGDVGHADQWRLGGVAPSGCGQEWLLEQDESCTDGHCVVRLCGNLEDSRVRGVARDRTFEELRSSGSSILSPESSCLPVDIAMPRHSCLVIVSPNPSFGGGVDVMIGVGPISKVWVASLLTQHLK